MHILRRTIRHSLDRALQPYLHSIETHAVDKGTQILLMLKYRQWLRNGWTLPTLEEVGFRCFSQTDEDGILLFLFSVIGVTTKRCIEVCAGDGIECCSANLIINHGWKALLFDGSPVNVASGNAFYARHRDTRIEPPQFVRAWIEAETINDLIVSHGIRGEIDLLVLALNGFFLREEIAPDLLPEVSIQSCLGVCRDKLFQQQAEAVLAQYEWVEV